MTGQSQCSCRCGNTLDPTISFQKSGCCGAKLTRKTFHYACSQCNQVVPSWFIFDERVFDSDYFREMMRESRARARRRKEEIKKFLIESRSSALPLMEEPNLESLGGLLEDLNRFVQEGTQDVIQGGFEPKSDFHMDRYHDHILSNLGWDSILFSDIASLAEDSRHDKAWRFVTLVFMQNSGEVALTQHGSDNLWVQKVHHEAYA